MIFKPNFYPLPGGLVLPVLLVVTSPMALAQNDPLMVPPVSAVPPLVRRIVDPAKAEVTPPGATVATRFKRSAKRSFLPKLVSRLAKTDDQKKRLTEAMEEGFKAYEKDAQEAGMSNDIAAAAAYFLAVQWSVFNDGKPAPDTGRLLAVVQLQRAMDGPELKKATDAEKQEFYEWCVATGTLVSVFSEVAADGGDSKMAAQIRKAAGEGIQNLLGVDPVRLNFTDRGLVVAPAEPAVVAPTIPSAPKEDNRKRDPS